MARRRGVDGFGLSVARPQSTGGPSLSSMVREAASAQVPARGRWGRAGSDVTLAGAHGDPNGKLTTLKVKGTNIAYRDVFGPEDLALGPETLDVGVEGALLDSSGRLVMDDSTGAQGRHPLLAERGVSGWGPSFAPDGRPKVLSLPGIKEGLRGALRARYEAEWTPASGRPRAMEDWLESLYLAGGFAMTQHDAQKRVLSVEAVPGALSAMCSGETVRFPLVDRSREVWDEPVDAGGFPLYVDMTVSFKKRDLAPFFSAVAFHSDESGVPIGNIRDAKRLRELWDSVGFEPRTLDWARARDGVALGL